MSESHNFEKHYETTPQPKVDQKAVLETGEIESRENFDGSWHIQRIKIKNDGIALFKIESNDPDSTRYALREYQSLVNKLNVFLDFNLIPASVGRSFEETSGVMEQFINEAKPAVCLRDWRAVVKQDEFMKAAIFDYLVDARDRHEANFLVDEKTGKIWLIDHDQTMFESGIYGSFLIFEFKGKEIPEEILLKLTILVQKVDLMLEKPPIWNALRDELNIESIWHRIRRNALFLLNTKKIS